MDLLNEQDDQFYNQVGFIIDSVLNLHKLYTTYKSQKKTLDALFNYQKACSDASRVTTLFNEATNLASEKGEIFASMLGITQLMEYLESSLKVTNKDLNLITSYLTSENIANGIEDLIDEISLKASLIKDRNSVVLQIAAISIATGKSLREEFEKIDLKGANLLI